MKKVIIGVLITVFMFPAFSQAVTTQELEAQRISLLEQIIVLLQARVQQLLALQPNIQPLVLGVSTTTVPATSTTTPTVVVKKRSGGGGGGGGSSSNNQTPLTLTMSGNENTFSITANQTLAPERFTLVLLNFPSNVDTPTTFTLQASTSNGSSVNMNLQKQATQSIYVAIPPTLPSGVTLTGQFAIVIPNEASSRNLVYSVAYEGNGTNRTINLENEGYAALEILPGSTEPDQTVLLSGATSTASVYISQIKNTGYVSADVKEIKFTADITPALPTNAIISKATLILTNDNSYTSFQSALRHPGVISGNTLTFSNLPAQVAGQATLYAYVALELVGTTTLLYPGDLTIDLTLSSSSIQAEHTNITNDKEIITIGAISATVSPYTLGLLVERGSVSATTSNSLTANFRIDIDAEVLKYGTPMYFTYSAGYPNDISQAFTFHIENQDGEILDERYTTWSIQSNEYPQNTVTSDARIQVRVSATPRKAGNYRLVVDSVQYTNNSNGETDVRLINLSDEFVTGYVTLTPPDLALESLSLIEDSIEITSESTGDNDETGIFSFKFDVTAVGEDYYIANRVNKDATNVTRGLAYTLDGTGQTETITTINSNASLTDEGTFHIEEGTTASFEVAIRLKTATTGMYRASITEINYSTFSDALSGIETITPDPTDLLRSDYRAIQSSTLTNPDQPVIETPAATSTTPYEAYIEVGEGSDNPDAAYLIVDEDNNTEFTILVADIEAEKTNILINKIVVRIDTPGATTENIIDDITLNIDGYSVDGNQITDLEDTDESAWYEFDTSEVGLLDENVKISIDVSVELEGQEGNYNNFQTIRAAIEAEETTKWVAETEDSLIAADIVGSITGEYHTLISSGLVVEPNSVETASDTSGENSNIGTFKIEFDVTAFEEDFYIKKLATQGTASATAGVGYEVTGPDGAAISATLTSTADEDTNNVYSVRDGETENFTLTVTIDPTVTGAYRVALSELNYTKNLNGITNIETLVPTPESDYRTSYQNVNAN